MNNSFRWSQRTRTALTRVVNAFVIALLLLGYAPAAAQAAQARRQAELCQPSSPATGVVFLPFIASGAQQLANTVRGLTAVQTPAARALTYEVGKTYEYEYEVTVNTRSSKRDSQGVRDDGNEKTVIRALAAVKITGQEDDGAFAGEVSLSNAFICSTDGEREGIVDDEETLNALATPLQFKQAVNGVITFVASPVDSPVQAINLQKGVVNALQLTLQDGDSYTAAEDAGQGAVNVQYTVAEQSDGLHITKSFNRSSFTSLITAGPPNDQLELENTVTIVVDGAKGVINSVAYSERIASGDGSPDPDGHEAGFDGVTVWSQADSTGKLTLKSITASSRVTAAAPDVVYQADSLGGTLTESHPNHAGIDLSLVDLNQAFADLESEPANPDHRTFILALFDADDDDPELDVDILGMIGQRLQLNVDNVEVANAYIDLLGAIGTPRAQEILNGVLGNIQVSAANLALMPFSDETREQALINIAILDSPTITTVNTVKGLVGDGSQVFASGLANVQTTALTVLGAVAHKLADENPDEAGQIAATLEEGLRNAQAPDEIELYLDALGNAGNPASLNTIQSYIDYQIEISSTVRSSQVMTNAVEVQVAALVALRKMPGRAAESLLLGVLTNEGELDVVRSIVADVMSTRDDLSQEAAAQLTLYTQRELATPGRHERSWNRRLGNSNLGVEFPGGMTLMSPPVYSGLYAYAHQRARALIYGRNFNVVTGELRSYRSGNNQVFGAYLTIGGNILRRQYETSVPCAASRSGTLYSGSVTFLNVTFSIPVFAVITLNINVRATGSFNLSYNFSISVCNPANMSSGAGITPRAWVTASASAYLNIVVARGGATLSANLLNTDMPAGVTASYNATNNNFRFCIDIRIVTQPLNGRLTVWADVRVPRWGIPPWKWKRLGEATLWTFSSPRYTYNLLVQCF